MQLLAPLLPDVNNLLALRQKRSDRRSSKTKPSLVGESAVGSRCGERSARCIEGQQHTRAACRPAPPTSGSAAPPAPPACSSCSLSCCRAALSAASWSGVCASARCCTSGCVGAWRAFRQQEVAGKVSKLVISRQCGGSSGGTECGLPAERWLAHHCCTSCYVSRFVSTPRRSLNPAEGQPGRDGPLHGHMVAAGGVLPFQQIGWGFPACNRTAHARHKHL